MDRVTIGKQLQRLREKHYPERSDLVHATGINYAQIKSAEDGNSFPRIDILERWLKACGTSLSKFFAEYESGVPSKRTPTDQVLERFSVLASADVELAGALVEIVDRVLKKTRSSNKPR